ncbi:MAG: RHS repeat-associated core domain-containing protein, partial [Anaerolineae bacterium]|nr:RHS repeat-associated core domain-containing protein [Anaerolineae bacterium]
MGARWYDPALGRWTSPDTIVPDPANPQSYNRYSYTLGNPVRYRDPSGHWVETAWDIANIAWDIYEVKKDPSLLNIGCLVVDVAAAALPFVPAGMGLIARGGKAAKVGVEVVT